MENDSANNPILPYASPAPPPSKRHSAFAFIALLIAVLPLIGAAASGNSRASAGNVLAVLSGLFSPINALLSILMARYYRHQPGALGVSILSAVISSCIAALVILTIASGNIC